MENEFMKLLIPSDKVCGRAREFIELHPLDAPADYLRLFADKYGGKISERKLAYIFTYLFNALDMQ